MHMPLVMRKPGWYQYLLRDSHQQIFCTATNCLHKLLLHFSVQPYQAGLTDLDTLVACQSLRCGCFSNSASTVAMEAGFRSGDTCAALQKKVQQLTLPLTA